VQKCKYGLGFAKQFCGRRIRKTETEEIFEIRRDFGFRPAGGYGRNAGRILFLAGGH